MENIDIKVKDLFEKINKLIVKLEETQEKINFNRLVYSYKLLKTEIYKLERKIEETKEQSKKATLAQELKEKVKNKEKLLSKLNSVENQKRRIFNSKNQINYLIKRFDLIKNRINIRIKRNEYKIQQFNYLLEKDYKDNLESGIEQIDFQIGSLREQIEEFKKEKKKTKHLVAQISILNHKKNDKKRQIKKIENANIENAKILKDKLIDENIKLYQDSNDAQLNIDQLLELIKKINNSLKFIDSDEFGENSAFTIKRLNVWYGSKQALFDINLDIPKNKVTSIIGPSGCGKSTFLKTLNRINDNIPSFKSQGKVILESEYDIFKLKSIKNKYDRIELSTLRTKVGMIFQQPNPFPMSILKNVQYGPKIKGIKNKAILNEITEQALKNSGIWEEVKDNLKSLATSLSGGQQQRICIARAIANEPDILLMDEPTSALDPIASKIIEDLIITLKTKFTIIMVTHSMQQAQRISDKTAFFYQGKLIEFGDTEQIFNYPNKIKTKEYISGKFG
ncbi:MAG: hypothetical protein TYPL_5240 [Candidatus Tyloplasma litorale]|nr:MAG: hypothetical protein TYPL_5240 [Mycoplasmatales bacterium]